MTSSRRCLFFVLSILTAALSGLDVRPVHAALSRLLVVAAAPGYEYVVSEPGPTAGPESTVAIRRRATVKGPFVDMETCETERRLDILGGRVRPLTECDKAGIFKELRKRRE